MDRRHLLFLLLAPGVASARPGRMEGITFAVERGEIYVPAEEAAKRLGWNFRSTKYDNAPMPWSVQVTGHIFIHGFTSVPDHPASHGCIRLPLDGGNPARFFYEWIDVGTPIHITANGS